MSVHTLERPALPRSERINTIRTDRDDHAPLSLRTELFLIAHDDQTGRRHLGERALTLGLSAAVLLELWFAGRIHIGWRYDVRRAGWVPDPGRIAVLDAEPTGDPIADAALDMLWRSPTTRHVGEFVREYATANLYERVRAYMIASGVLHRTTRRRFWFFRREGYVPVETAFSVRARTRIRRLAGHRSPGAVVPPSDHHHLALAALVMALGLTPYLFPPEMSMARLVRALRETVGTRADPAVREVAAALAPGRTLSPPASH